jgi:two-component sensor histidine kinase
MNAQSKLAPAGADSLALSMIASSHEPLLLLDRDQNIVAASASFCRAFQVDPTGLKGRALASLGRGEWNIPQVGALLALKIAGRGQEIADYETDLKGPGRDSRHLVLHADKLAYDDTDDVRVLLAVSDVTQERLDQRFVDDLVREKALLLDELQHRVANSLQIIASVLMQSARRVNSDESRAHLYEAHQRVMSVASLQKHLAQTRLGDVEMRTYLTDLCGSIAASMIQDREHTVLEVHADDSVSDPDTSMSLGLLVTELVINALKHAFPGQRRGRITINYHAHGSAWRLSVSDDGVGVADDPKSSKPGLGTSIVQALARQLHADVAIVNTEPGTAVTVTRHQTLLLAEEVALKATTVL